MSRIALMIPALLAMVALTSSAADPDPKAEFQALVGKWDLVKSELGGKDVTSQLKELDFRIKANGAYTATVGKEMDEGSFTIDLTKDPKQMDITSTGKGGPNAGKTIKAIYKLEGNKLVVCYALGGGDRPTKFTTTAGTREYMAEYKRGK